MADVAVLKRPEFAPRTLPTSGTGTQSPIPGASAVPSGGVTNAISAITTFIPSEILTLYVAVVAALTPPEGTTSVALFELAGNTVPATWVAFWAFLVATPVVVWLMVAAKLRSLNRALPLDPREWPHWEMFAATIAFLAWAFALPDSVFSDFRRWYSPAIAGVVVLVTTAALGLLSQVVVKVR